MVETIATEATFLLWSRKQVVSRRFNLIQFVLLEQFPKSQHFPLLSNGKMEEVVEFAWATTAFGFWLKCFTSAV